MTNWHGNPLVSALSFINDDVPVMLIDPPWGGDEVEWESFIKWLLDLKKHRSCSWLDDVIASARISLDVLKNPVAILTAYEPSPGIKARLEANRNNSLQRSVRMQLPDTYRTWANSAVEFGFTDFVSAEDGFRTELQSNAPWVNSAACGIYYWVAQDGETYVGKTVNARARLREHWRNHPDLTYAAFQAVPASMLDEREQTLISEVEALFSTRNIKHALQTQTHVPFDNFVNEFDQAEFLKGNIDLDDSNWRELNLLVQKQSRKHARFAKLPDADIALDALAIFVGRVIPRPAATESRFWSVSLFVQTVHVMRLNAGQQEVFTITQGNDGEMYVRVFSAAEFGPESEGPMYQTQSYEAVMPARDLDGWLVGDRLSSCRELVVRLMRHTTTLNSGSHCPQLMRAIAAGAD